MSSPLGTLGPTIHTNQELLEIRSVKTDERISTVNITTDRNIILYTVTVVNKTKDITVDTIQVVVPEGIRIVGDVVEPLLPEESFQLHMEVNTSVTTQKAISIKPGIIAIQES